ncbi:MAG: BatD family protein [Candidatus Omnitrophica bacterium]|nr:BatD family protein [Candidatus Omnitrophota bacterium]
MQVSLRALVPVSLRAKRSNLFLCLLMLLSSTGTLKADTVSFEASVNSSRISLSEVLQLNLTVTGLKDNIDPISLPVLDGFSAKYLGPSTRVSIVNGDYHSERSFVYDLFPNKVGHFQIPPISATIAGQTYVTKPIDIEVVADSAGAQAPAPQQAQDQAPSIQSLKDKILILVSLEKEEVYLNERVPLSVKLLVNDVPIRDIQFPQFDKQGFAVDDFQKPQQYSQVLNGVKYDAVEFKSYIYPTHLGDVPIGPFQIAGNVVYKNGNNNPFNQDMNPFGGGLFKDFFDSYATRPVTVTSRPLPMHVRALPQEGRPRDFSGAVGQFDFQASVSPLQVKAGDPITLKMSLKGNGNFKSVTMPVFQGAGFKTYEPKIKDQADEKTAEEVIIPTSAQVTQVPALHFSYFDTSLKDYKTITQGPFAIQVMPNAPDEGFKAVGFSDVSREPATLHIDQFSFGKMFHTIRKGLSKLCKSIGFWLTLGLIIVGGGSYFLWRRFQERLENDPAFARRLKAYTEAKQTLRMAQGYISTGKSKDFYTLLSRAIREYLANKWHQSPASLSIEEILKQLKSAGIDETHIEGAKNILTTSDLVCFAGANRDASQMQSDLSLTQNLINHLHISLRAPKGRSNLLSLFFSISLLLTATAWADLPWVKQQSSAFSGEGVWFGAAMSADGSRLILLDVYNGLYISTNGGASWSQYNPSTYHYTYWRAVPAMSSDGSHVMAGSYQYHGRLYLSVNGGVIWSETRPAGDNDLNWSVTAMSGDASHLLAGVGSLSGRLYLSSDGGAHWVEIQPDGNNDENWNTAAISSDGSHLIVGEYNNGTTNRGRLFFSKDGGATWSETQPAGATEQYWKFVTTSSDGSHFMAGINGGQIYTGVLSGGIISWTGGVSRGWYVGASSSDESYLLAGVYVGRLYYSTNGTAGTPTWTETRPAGANNYVWNAGSISSDGTHMMAGIQGGEVFISTNGATSWSETKPQIDQNWDTVASSRDGKYLMAGHDRHLYHSVDGGSTWSENQPAGNLNRYWYLTASSGDGTILLAGVAGARLYLSTNGTVSTPTWATTNPVTSGGVNRSWYTGAISRDGSHVIVGSYSNTGRLWVGVVNAGTITWSEAGTAAIGLHRDWQTTAISSDGTYVMAGNYLDSNYYAGRLYVGVLSGGVYSWNEKQPAGNLDVDWVVTAMSADGSHMMAATIPDSNGDPGGLYLSYDGGTTWSSPTDLWIVNSDQYWQIGFMSSDGNYIVVGDDSSLYESTDAGITWRPLNFPADVSYNGYSLNAVAGSSDASHLIAASNGIGLYVSAVGGKASNLTQVQNLTQVTF